ncbi:ABC transporter, ATP-binding protein [hydrothermal vent metagenome]|uniref:ABC transporter, ATP-binding protein n=1 Tax=hydrothermal vent metagenome TaxID=652676 RepID=A0A3B0WFU9_9ZZZZ
MNHIKITNLNIQFDDLKVLKNFNACFDTGVHWVQGFNGSGKISLLKSLCGIVPVNNNAVSILGFDLKSQALKAKSKLCFIPDKPDIYPFMTGMQFLELLAKIKGVKLSSELFEFIDAINLTPFTDVAFGEMSFGTRRKFTLCSVFISNPQVVLLDEPFNGLDKHTTEQFRLWLIEARKTKCVLVVSHDTHIIESISDSTIVLGS